MPAIAREAGAALVLALALAAAAPARPAPGGEGGPPRPPTPEEIQLRRIPRAVGGAALVAVVRITEVGKPQAAAENLADDEGQFKQIFSLPNMWDKIRKRRIEAEVTEVLRGDKDTKKLSFTVWTSLATGKELLVVIDTAGMAAANPFKAHYRNPSCPFALEKDKTALVFLRAREKPAEEGKPAEKVWWPAGPFFAGAPAAAIGAVKETLAKLAAWDRPPKLSAEDDAAARKLVTDLGSGDFNVREAATKALAGHGAGIKPLLEEVLKTSSDPEVKTRAEQVLEELKPEILRPDPAAQPGVPLEM
jgi:hypothetical protein